ncbi:conserved Plasmodium protein, unknown function [Plasmodium knowlesi strain H]|uniref:Uncharacterized protein n=3 Tax=Plasmodium knowlesi TaxID=5850 RepID=A0A5K1V080_PLAKH|nr:conserved Plasmodium protein, unknown function [Plasmodium knowlesi strain H]OTN64777.1 Uncharacterized protein PKNOH_S130170700 [Plasmodium knowlesi]CAA9988875.1 conserved Plasmodium protein, unknown function [Plasmodium knowlesi strain H]SBO24711.1 conserved Plasmodium protein, unknown function [Plasmodium knowlesi strain H]SBO27984.1 conserved Plasmodium protein, unknown function [Plasmodium knowlesi strain H]VVS78349.1 conserved Plasmodium protein, unknown function [Plasmodium knowlesi |eukprot:XP_002261221.1 hypothetical protein, conserved in Plasmodium species [Plasmodium knowlesi strain H]
MNPHLGTPHKFTQEIEENGAIEMENPNLTVIRIKNHIRRYLELDKKFYELFIRVMEISENLFNNFKTTFKEVKKDVTDYLLNDEEFFKKKKDENGLKEKQNAIEELIRELSTVVLHVGQNCKNMRELFLCLYMLIFESAPDEVAAMGGSLSSHIVSHSNSLTESSTVASLLSQNKISEQEFEVARRKGSFVSDLYSRGEINKMVRRCLMLCSQPALSSHHFTKQIKIFFLLTAVMFYMEEDIKMRIKICNLISSEIHISILNIKKCSIILKHNPYLNKIKRLLNKF